MADTHPIMDWLNLLTKLVLNLCPFDFRINGHCSCDEIVDCMVVTILLMTDDNVSKCYSLQLRVAILIANSKVPRKVSGPNHSGEFPVSDFVAIGGIMRSISRSYWQLFRLYQSA